MLNQIFVLKGPGVLATAVCRKSVSDHRVLTDLALLHKRAELMSGGVMLPPLVVAPLIQTSRALRAALFRDNSGPVATSFAALGTCHRATAASHQRLYPAAIV